MQLFEYQIQLLKLDILNMFLPMNFYSEFINGRVETSVEYDFDNHLPLKEWLSKENLAFLELLDILEKIIYLILKCNEVLIDYEDLQINLETLYLSTNNENKIRLQYKVRSDSEEIFNLSNLILEMEGYLNETYAEEYLEKIRRKIELEKPDFKKTILMIAQVKREIHICGWIGKSRAN